ncbi:MAG TPA: hypothetical protein PKE12_07165 [Kiritimatiellia bacterium]|nr:hypothetical protein [Kiritimatiellia bacterium]
MARRRNRNYRKKARTAPISGPLVLVLISAMGLAFGWLWLNNRCELLGTRIKELEQERTALRRRVANEEFKWSSLTTYESMMKLLKEHRIEMDWPRERQIVRIRRAAGDEGAETSFARN